MRAPWWFWHLLYDNRLFGRWLWTKVRERQWHREFGGVEFGIYGLNYIWQQQQREYIIAENGGYRLVGPRSGV